MDKIAVATDFSARSDQAVLRAKLIAQKTGAELALIHIVDDDQPEEVIVSSRSIAMSVLRGIARTLENDGVAADPVVGVGDIARGILAAADAVAADLIVVGPHRKRPADVFIGTTVERVVRRSERPLLVAVGSPSKHHRRTLLAIDFDDASKAAARAALDLGVFDHTDVVVMHAFDAMGDGLMLRTFAPPSEVNAYRAGERINTISALHDLLGELSLPVSTTRVVAMNGSPARTILESAEHEAADLIIVGTNQRKGFARLLVGSIAGDVIRDTQRDILIVPTA